MHRQLYSTRQVAKKAQIHKDTLLRWLRQGKVREPSRDRNGWRVFSEEEAQAIIDYASQDRIESELSHELPYSEAVRALPSMNWDFVGANTGFLTHSIHPYPAKFIPQIPNVLIQELSSVGETILDPFCGSGTTLVEALRLGRRAIGIDANPLACLISRAKTSHLDASDADHLRELAVEIRETAQTLSIGTLPLFPQLPVLPVQDSSLPFKGADEWFDKHVIEELTFIKERCLSLEPTHLREIALVAFSAIIVSVSRQDSETRYVRRDKNIKSGDTLNLFSSTLSQCVQKIRELSEEVDPHLVAQVITANTLDSPDIGPVHLVICSPPYPNAFSYHLYHRTRMLWLDMDQPKFKKQEIGSHRKYSGTGKNAATVDTFKGELYRFLSWTRKHLHPGRHVCIVIGDSTIKGETIKNDELLIEIAEPLGFVVEANFNRVLQANKKYFNPVVGKIKDEHIVIMRSLGG